MPPPDFSNDDPACDRSSRHDDRAEVPNLRPRGFCTQVQHLKIILALSCHWRHRDSFSSVTSSQLPICQTAKGSCWPEVESLRSSPSVPRGAPQCRHLISVEDGAFSAQSKMIPSPSQILQTILNPGRMSGESSTCETIDFVIVILKIKPPSGI
jgi:hypothetical protein